MNLHSVRDCLTLQNIGGDLMAFEIAGMAAKAVETGKKVIEVAKKTEKVVSSVEKPVKAVEKVTAEKDGNWGADIVKSGVQKGVGEIKSGLAEKLKDYLGKDDVASSTSETNADTGKQADVKENQEGVESKEGKTSFKDRINKYLDSADSQSNNGEDVQEDNISDKKENGSNDIQNDNLNHDNEENSENSEKSEKSEDNSDSILDNDAPNSNNDAANEVNTTEYNEDGTRELTEDEKQAIKDKFGWSDEKIKKCTIDKDGVIHYKTDRCDLEGKTSENGVPYERRRIVINGVVIEGVFPKFDSLFDTELAPDNLKTKAYAKECNAALKEAIANDPELRSKFTPEQLKDIEEGRTPTGYVWHHNEEPGKMQLVKREDHDRAIGGAAHTGGNSLWGADSVDNGKKGESF